MRAYCDQALSALKFLYEQVLNLHKLDIDIPRPRRERKLPDVLSEEEVIRVLTRMRNLKPRVLFMLIYSADRHTPYYGKS